MTAAGQLVVDLLPGTLGTGHVQRRPEQHPAPPPLPAPRTRPARQIRQIRQIRAVSVHHSTRVA
ncbi:hypothetical protein [Streptomyces sp. LN704]|uniref:hypothetical protein n=1 Tax=Streptomyces sp. LN704 TaxID=3112982 RepID=UPI003711A893